MHYIPHFRMDATDPDDNFHHFNEQTPPAHSPMQPQPGGQSAISLYNLQSDPTTGSNSSYGVEYLINPLIDRFKVPRYNPPDNP